MLFVPSTARDDEWQGRLTAEVKRLGTVLRQALAVDGQTVGIPVYQALKGLRPADWSAIETARAKYFEGILDDWQARVRIARVGESHGRCDASGGGVRSGPWRGSLSST